MNVAFRVDSSMRIGSGHVMRCLALANALRRRSANCVFVVRPQAGDSLGAVEAEGFEVRRLPEAPPPHSGGYAQWLGAPWADDAAQTLAMMADMAVWDWLVVDHYAIDRRWELLVHAASARLLVIDDLADRPHEAELLLDQTLGRAPEDYRPLVNADCELSCGVQHALLRPEFAGWRAASLARRATAPFAQIMVSLGGVDQDNLTRRVLLALNACRLPCRVLVVLGGASPWVDDIRSLAAGLDMETEVCVGVGNMAELMAASDLAIGAAGSSAWERCCLGLPSLMVVLAENQLKIAAELENAGAARLLPADGGLEKTLAALVTALMIDPAALREMSRCSATLISQGGTEKMADRMMQACP